MLLSFHMVVYVEADVGPEIDGQRLIKAIDECGLIQGEAAALRGRLENLGYRPIKTEGSVQRLRREEAIRLTPRKVHWWAPQLEVPNRYSPDNAKFDKPPGTACGIPAPKQRKARQAEKVDCKLCRKEFAHLLGLAFPGNQGEKP